MKGSKQRILDYLLEHRIEGLTSKEAFELFGITRLSARIFDLRGLGYNIDTLMIEGVNRYGEPCRYARYVYKGKKQGYWGENNGN